MVASQAEGLGAPPWIGPDEKLSAATLKTRLVFVHFDRGHGRLITGVDRLG